MTTWLLASVAFGAGWSICHITAERVDRRRLERERLEGWNAGYLDGVRRGALVYAPDAESDDSEEDTSQVGVGAKV